MRRSWNGVIWAGLLAAVAALFSYIPVFVRFPVTRDVPWVNLLLFGIAILLLGVGLKRAFGQPDRYRGKVTGVVFLVFTLAALGLFCYGNFVFARQVPLASGAPKAGQQAPAFTLADADGKPVTLASMLQTHRAVVLIFYRGYW